MSEYEQLPTSSKPFVPPTIKPSLNEIGICLWEYGATLEVKREAHAYVARILDHRGQLIVLAEDESFAVLMEHVRAHCYIIIDGLPE